MKKIFITVVLTLAVLALLFVAFIYSGIYNVSAKNGESAPLAWILSTTMERSVRAHAGNIKLPPGFGSLSTEEGFKKYHVMCQPCHGGPGFEPSEVGMGIDPRPPELKKVADEWSKREVFWIVKNGIKMSGMAAFGKSHTNEEIWPIVAFVKKLPQISDAQYKDLLKKSEKEKPVLGHEMKRGSKRR